MAALTDYTGWVTAALDT